jgi:hypothetical protein
MSAEDMVDAALAGLDQEEIVTIPSLPDNAQGDGFEAPRRALAQRFGHSLPVPQYRAGRFVDRTGSPAPNRLSPASSIGQYNRHPFYTRENGIDLCDLGYEDAWNKDQGKDRETFAPSRFCHP